MQKYVCCGGVGVFFGILIMSIALLATSFRRLESDEGKTAYCILSETKRKKKIWRKILAKRKEKNVYFAKRALGRL